MTFGRTGQEPEPVHDLRTATELRLDSEQALVLPVGVPGRLQPLPGGQSVRVAVPEPGERLDHPGLVLAQPEVLERLRHAGVTDRCTTLVEPRLVSEVIDHRLVDRLCRIEHELIQIGYQLFHFRGLRVNVNPSGPAEFPSQSDLPVPLGLHGERLRQLPPKGVAERHGVQVAGVDVLEQTGRMKRVVRGEEVLPVHDLVALLVSEPHELLQLVRLGGLARLTELGDQIVVVDFGGTELRFLAELGLAGLQGVLTGQGHSVALVVDLAERHRLTEVVRPHGRTLVLAEQALGGQLERVVHDQTEFPVLRVEVADQTVQPADRFGLIPVGDPGRLDELGDLGHRHLADLTGRHETRVRSPKSGDLPPRIEQIDVVLNLVGLLQVRLL